MNLRLPTQEIRFDFARSSGPGGQNVNKVNSKVLMIWNVADTEFISGERKDRFLERFGHRITHQGEIIITSEVFRDRPRNIKACQEKLAAMLDEIWLPPKVRRATRPTKSSVRRRIHSKKQRSEKKRSRQRPGVDD